MTQNRTAALFALIVAVGALATALVAQYGFGLYPCLLCIWQRWAYGAVIALALAALLLPAARLWLSRLTVLALLSVAALATFHAGVEQKWWKGFSSCSGADLANAGGADAIKEAILAAPTTACDEIPWELMGLSIAGFNAIFALLFAVITWRLIGRRA